MSVHMFACVYMCVEIDGKSYLPNNIISDKWNGVEMGK